MNHKPTPQNKFEQYVSDKIDHIDTALQNHLKHHTKWSYGLVIAIIGLIGSLLLALLK